MKNLKRLRPIISLFCVAALLCSVISLPAEAADFKVTLPEAAISFVFDSVF